MVNVIRIIILLCLFCIPLESAELSGVVKRPPKKAKVTKKVDRYRNSAESSLGSQIEDCQCNPRLYSVISLTPDQPFPILPFKDTLTMAQRSKAFDPSVLAVTVNSTVSFPNLDPFYHNVFSYSKTKKFDLGKYPKNETKYVTFDKPGIVKVFCEIHYSMRAYVHILETPYIAVSDETGRFDIPDLPQGNYEIRVWQEGLPDIVRNTVVDKDSVWLEIE